MCFDCAQEYSALLVVKLIALSVLSAADLDAAEVVELLVEPVNCLILYLYCSHCLDSWQPTKNGSTCHLLDVSEMYVQTTVQHFVRDSAQDCS